MTSWPSQITFQRQLDHAGLHCTTSGRSGLSLLSMQHNFSSRPWSFLGLTTAMLFWLDFHHVQPNLYKWFRMLQLVLSSTSPRGPTSLLCSSLCTGYLSLLASSSRHWRLLTDLSQAQLPPTFTHSYESTSLPEAYDRSTSDVSWFHHRKPQNHFPEHSHSQFHAGGMISPPSSGMQNPWQHSKDSWKPISSVST